ncbi:isochorismatase family protein [Brevibacterium salitolerans]|uniref:Isochorismatase-like domain-containing protein n=1 Tax=Brevibacterium salitolerans TaxID=1403566 RepID=A0ABN2WQC1_9MICO
MDALLLIDTTAPAFSADSPAALADLLARARGVGGVILHVVGSAVEAAGDGGAGAVDGPHGDGARGRGPDGAEGAPGAAADGPAEFRSVYADAEDGDEEETGPVAPVIDTVYGTGEDELVLVSEAPDAFEGVEELAEGLDDLGVDRLIVAGGDGRGAVYQTSMAALVLGFEVVLAGDAVRTPEGGQVDWLADAEDAGAVVKPAGDVWLKM